MIIAGLTGGIASGKSTVSKLFKNMGAEIIDADQIAREAVSFGQPAYFEIVDHFGKIILDKNKEIDRKRLADIIFKSKDEKERLNGIVHPQVKKMMDQSVQSIASKGLSEVTILDVPLLIEANMHQGLDQIILVWVPEDIQMMRLIHRDNLSKREALLRVESQMPLDRKKAFASRIIDNSGVLHHTKRQAEKIYKYLLLQTK